MHSAITCTLNLASCYFFKEHNPGIKEVHKLVHLCRSLIDKFVALLRKGIIDPDEELRIQLNEHFWKAFRTFHRQQVYCTEKGIVKCIFLVDENTRDALYLGLLVTGLITTSIVFKDLNPDMKLL